MLTKKGIDIIHEFLFFSQMSLKNRNFIQNTLDIFIVLQLFYL